MIEIENLTRNFGGREALVGVSLTISPGQLVAVVGPNGSGKTTLFRLLLGLIDPTAGSMRLWGKPPAGQPANVFSRIGAVLDNHVPLRGTRIKSLLSLKAAAAPAFDESWCRALLDELPGVTPARRFGELSKGQKQWVLSAVALASRAELLILDEPGDGLDTAARRKLFALLRSAVDDRGATVLVASHVLTDLERVADRLVVLNRGAVRLEAELEDLRQEVREIEFEGGLPDLGTGAAVELLAARNLSEGTLAWIRRHDWQTLPPPWPGERSRRPVGLEELYLALTAGISTLGTDGSEHTAPLVSSVAESGQVSA
jgi:ABC-2 type transport system ATP-binding protein